MAHEGADISAYDPAIMDADRHYFSTKLITTGIVYNTGAPMKPTSYKDLLKPDANGKIAMPSPLTSGAATIHMATLTGNPDLGWAYYEGLADQGVTPKGGNGGTYKAIAGGEKLYGFVVDFLPIRNKLEGAPVEFVFPSEGVSAVTEPVAILSTAQNPEAAKAFVDFLLSPEGQQMAADQGYLAAHPAIAPPEGFPSRDSIKLMSFDPAKALKDDKANKEKFLDIFGAEAPVMTGQGGVVPKGREPRANSFAESCKHRLTPLFNGEGLTLAVLVCVALLLFVLPLGLLFRIGFIADGGLSLQPLAEALQAGRSGGR